MITKAVRDALGLAQRDKLTWPVKGDRVAVTTECPALFQFEGVIKHGKPASVKAVAEARTTRGRI